MLSMENFGEWLLRELKKRELSQSDLSKISGLSRGTLSNLINGTRGIGPDSLLAIAKALKLPPTQVFEAAGILPPKAGEDPWVEQMDLKLRSIKDPNKREIAEKMLDALIDENASKKVVSPKKNLSTGKA